MREVKGQPFCWRIFRPCRGLIGKRDFPAGLAKHLPAHAIEHQLAVLYLGAADKFRDEKPPGAILDFIVVKRPPGPRLQLRCHVRFQRRDLPGGQRPIIDARIIDRPREMRVVRLPAVTFADVHPARRAKLLRPFGHRVLRIRLTVPVNGDLSSSIDDRDLDEGFRIGGFGRESRLLPLRASEEIAAGHPFRGCQLAKDDRIEMVASVIDGQRAAASLG